jgi:hypothetical protein
MTAALADAVPAPRKPITIRPAPRREPPFDDEAPHLRLVGRHDQALPFDPWPGRLREVMPWQAPRATGRGDLPEPSMWGRRMLIAVLEARAGRRSLKQVGTLLSPGVHAGLARDLARSGASRRRGELTDYRVRSIHVSEPADGVAELAAVVQVGERFRAVAARLEGLDGRWRCVRLQIG